MTYLNSKSIIKLIKKPRMKLLRCAILIQWNLVMITSHAKPLSSNKEKLNFLLIMIAVMSTINNAHLI